MGDRNKRIYLMTDYDSSSLWTDEPFHYMVSADSLPLRRETAAALAEWSRKLFEFLEHEDDAEWLAEQEPLHDREGLRLWRVVREELGSDYEVGFAIFEPDPVDPDDAVKRIVWDPSQLGAPWA